MGEELDREVEKLLKEIDFDNDPDFQVFDEPGNPQPFSTGPWPELRHEVWDRERRVISGEKVDSVTIGRFELWHSIGWGGMGVVFEAWDPLLEREVALKLWDAEDPEAKRGLLHEAQLLAQLKHPNVVTIHEAGEHEGHVFVVMDNVVGVDGRRWIEGVESWEEAVDVYVAAGRGLAAAHDLGIIHHDFKPSNLLIGKRGEVCVCDFGVAEVLNRLRSTDDEEPQKRAGTVAYMAPERLAGQRGDARSDQFSLCVSLWQTLYAVRPFAGKTREELLESIDAGALREDDNQLSGIPRSLRKVVTKGLARDPDARHRDMYELVGALERVPELRRARWRGVLQGLALLLAMGAGALVVVLAWPRPGLDIERPVVVRVKDEPGQTTEAPSETLSPGELFLLIEDERFDQAWRGWQRWYDWEHAAGHSTAQPSLALAMGLLEKALGLPDHERELAYKLAARAESMALAAEAELLRLEEPAELARGVADDARCIMDGCP